jgi:hypothetical protein
MTLSDMRDLARANKWKGYSQLGFDQLYKFTAAHINAYLPLD